MTLLILNEEAPKRDIRDICRIHTPNWGYTVTRWMTKENPPVYYKTGDKQN